MPLACYSAIALGTMSGGWKIIKTMGTRITKVTPFEGVAAETAGAVTLFLTAGLKIPVSRNSKDLPRGEVGYKTKFIDNALLHKEFTLNKKFNVVKNERGKIIDMYETIDMESAIYRFVQVYQYIYNKKFPTAKEVLFGNI